MFKKAAIYHFGYLKDQLFKGWIAEMCHIAKFHQNHANSCGDKEFSIFKMVAIAHLQLAGRVFGPPTNSTWGSIYIQTKKQENPLRSHVVLVAPSCPLLQ